MSSRFVAAFRTFPKELFRVNNGYQIKLREWSPERHVFDIVTHDGRVKAKALDPSTYQAPNGASMRPNSPYQQHLVSRLFRGPDVIVYAIPAGTRLPEDLILVHERSDHYSLQPARDMTVERLNSRITSFLRYNGEQFTREQWLDKYRVATDLPPW